jgi:hypothetical protein
LECAECRGFLFVFTCLLCQEAVHIRVGESVLLAFEGRESDGADNFYWRGEVDFGDCAAETDCFEEGGQALYGAVLYVSRAEGAGDPVAEDARVMEGADVDEGEQGAQVVEGVLDGRSGEAPPNFGGEFDHCAVEGGFAAADHVGYHFISTEDKLRGRRGVPSSRTTLYQAYSCSGLFGPPISFGACSLASVL